MKNIAFIQNLGPLVGRLMIAFLFIMAGTNKIMNSEDTMAMMDGAGLPVTTFLLVVTIIIELLGGVLIAVGWYARFSATVIFLFLIPVTLVFHNPVTDPAEMTAFMKNLAIMGGLLYVTTYGPGNYSINKE